MREEINKLEEFLTKAIEEGHVYVTKCFNCGITGIRVSLDQETDFECEECGSTDLEVEELE